MDRLFTVIGFLDSNQAPWRWVVRADNANDAIGAAVREYCQQMSESPDNVLVIAVIPGTVSNEAATLNTAIRRGNEFVAAQPDDVDLDVGGSESREHLEARRAHAENRLGNPGVNY